MSDFNSKTQLTAKRSRTSMEKALIGVTIFAFLVVIGLSAGLGYVATRKTENGTVKVMPMEQEYCLTAGCAKAAVKIISALDTSVKPCDDFFQYSCGTWNLKHPIAEDKSRVSTFGVLFDELVIQLKGILEMPAVANEAAAIGKARILYKSCMNEDDMMKQGAKDLFTALGQLGTWPMIDTTWNNANFDFTDVMIQADEMNTAHLLSVSVDRDSRNASNYVIQIDQPNLGMPSRSYYLKERNDTKLMAYQNYIASVAMMLADEKASFTFIKQDVIDMVDFEIELAKIIIKSEDLRDSNKLYHPVVLSEMQQNFSSAKVMWSKYIKGMFKPVKITVPDNERMILTLPKFYHNLTSLIENTNNRILANYIGWRYVKKQITALPQQYRDLYQDYRKALYGSNSAPARWHTCVSSVNRHLGHATGRLYIDNAFSAEAKETAKTLIHSIISQFKKLLASEEWLDDATRKVAKEKADAVIPKIAYPDYIMDNDKLDEKYANVTLVATSSYMVNLLRINMFKSKRNAYRLEQAATRTVWGTTAAIVNAFYQPTRNDITFPAGILQPPFYSHGYPMSINFGGIGVVIGHELTHGFDDEGRQYDKYGNLAEWWSAKIIANFKEKAQCIIDQYSGFVSPVANMHLNGVRTQGENIADNGGIGQAYYAYQDWVKEHGAEPKLPGTNLTHNQLFFLGFSQVWCGALRKAAAENRILTDPHAPGRFRVWGVMQNSKEFSEAFKCKEGDKMNPPASKKCKVW